MEINKDKKTNILYMYGQIFFKEITNLYSD